MLSTYASRSILRHRYVVFLRCAGLPCSFIALYLFLLLRLFPLCISSLPLLVVVLWLFYLLIGHPSLMLCVVSSIRFGSIVLLRFLRVSHIIIDTCVDFEYVGCMRNVNLMSQLNSAGVRRGVCG